MGRRREAQGRASPGRKNHGQKNIAICALIIVSFLLGAYLGATKSKSVTRRIDRDNAEG
jgi:hypothetical protein